MCFGRRKITHAVVDAAVATIVPRTQAISVLFSGGVSAARAPPLLVTLAAALLQRCCRAARAAKRWCSRSLLMHDGVKAPASASMRALSRAPQFFFLAVQNPHKTGFIVDCVLHRGLVLDVHPP